MTITRRLFLASLGSAGAGFGLGGVSHFFPLPSPRIGEEWSPGKEEFVPSTCLLCPAHCGIRGRVVDGHLVRVDGNPLHPVSRGGLCAKGRAGLQLLYHPARLSGPRERTGSAGSDAFSPVNWESALERVSGTLARLRDSDRAGAAVWLVGDVQGSMSELLERFASLYGSPSPVREGYGDGSEQVMELCHGVRVPPAFDLERTDLVVSFGAPVSEAWWCLPQSARARDRPPQARGRWIQIDTRLSRSAIAADRWIPVRPGGYGAVAMAIAYVLLKDGLYDAEWIRDGVSGFDDWKDDEGNPVLGYRNLVLRHGRPEDVARGTGMPVNEIVRLAKDFGRARRPLALWDHVVTWRTGGLSDALAIHALNILTGSLERPGGIFIQPPLPVPVLDQIEPTRVRKPAAAPMAAGADWADRILEAGASPVEVLFLYYANPVASAPDPQKVRNALARIPLVVSFSPFLDETARHAHLVLPDHTFLERWQDAAAPSTVPYPVWGVVQPVVPPLHDTRATGDVILELAQRLGGELAGMFPWNSMQEVVEAHGRALADVERGSAFVPGFRRDELRELEARGWWIAHGQDPGSFWESVRTGGGWFDPYHDGRGRFGASRRKDGRTALFPQEARDRLATGVPGLAEGFLPTPSESEAPAGDVRRELRIIPYRVMTLASGGTPLMPWLLENLGPITGDAWTPWVEVHPETAAALGVRGMRRVRVVSEHGSFVARLRLFQGAQPGVVNVPYGMHSSVDGLAPSGTANPLAAVGSARDPVSGLPDWYSTRVRIEAV